MYDEEVADDILVQVHVQYESQLRSHSYPVESVGPTRVMIGVSLLPLLLLRDDNRHADRQCRKRLVNCNVKWLFMVQQWRNTYLSWLR